ncbi:hypothetical protein LY76DRAFT_610805 [Colletotrichum caudatum]|nr:hypothetical protein LY76DRAFT_610805 [Colletotrichum caudatum]
MKAIQLFPLLNPSPYVVIRTNTLRQLYSFDKSYVDKNTVSERLSLLRLRRGQEGCANTDVVSSILSPPFNEALRETIKSSLAVSFWKMSFFIVSQSSLALVIAEVAMIVAGTGFAKRRIPIRSDGQENENPDAESPFRLLRAYWAYDANMEMKYPKADTSVWKDTIVRGSLSFSPSTMYQPRTERPLPRLPHQIQPQRQAPYPRTVRVPRRSGYQQAAVSRNVRAQRQAPITSAAQGRDSPNSVSTDPQLLQSSSTTSSRKLPETQEDDPELRTYISEEFGNIKNTLCDVLERLCCVEEKVDGYYRIVETAGALGEPEGLETDNLELEDMTTFVNY